MKIGELKKILETDYTDNDEVCVLWWDKKTFDYDPDDENVLTDKAWSEICDEFDSWDDAGVDIGQWVADAVIEKAEENK